MSAIDPSLSGFFEQLDLERNRLSVKIPPKRDTQQLADGLFELLFPINESVHYPAEVRYGRLKTDLERLLQELMDDSPDDGLPRLIDRFFLLLPQLHTALLEDASAILMFDPAATCIEEVIATYPGFYAIANYRIANLLHRLGVPLLPRFFSEYVHGKTGIDIHPAATIGRSFFIDHGTGVVIGATAVIGNHVKIYQGITLGALQVDKSLANVKRHPTIEDNCVLYANCTILGGKTTVGHDTVVGGNAWLTESVPPFSIVVHQSQVKVRTRAFDEPINFVI